MAKPKCKYCGREVMENVDFRAVWGYERISRSAGGTNALRCRKPTETFACRWCVDKLSKGLHPGQERML